jgi:hypothetical protein
VPNYDWNDFAAAHWLDRYAPWSQGYSEWHAQLPDLFALDAVPLPALDRPRLFVSHRQVDSPRAERVAWLANDEGFEFWLDVLDPGLTTFQTFASSLSMPTPALHAIGIARIIEMALHNSSHVLALLTANSAGSAWIPYEYGRIHRGAVPWPAAAWVDPLGITNHPTPPLPEYLYLGAIAKTEQEIRTWLNGERRNWERMLGRPITKPAGRWTAPIPLPL